MYPSKKPKVPTFKINTQIKTQFKESKSEISIFIVWFQFQRRIYRHI